MTAAIEAVDLTKRYGAYIDMPKLAPHDTRRTFAELARLAGIDLLQISILLGHKSIETTRLYLNVEVDLQRTASDFIPC